MSTKNEPSGKNRLWVVAIIAVSAAVEVWASWVGLGSLAGFPDLDLLGIVRVPTNWTLGVGMEAYGAYALWVWLAAAPGERSRRFAMCSAISAFSLSLVGQVGYHLMLATGQQRAPEGLVGFVATLPVIVLILAAVLTELMRSDKHAAEAAAKAGREAEEKAAAQKADQDAQVALRTEINGLKQQHAEDLAALAEQDDADRAERDARASEIAAQHEAALEALRAELAEANDARTEAERQRERAEANAAKLARKLDANSTANGPRTKGAQDRRKPAEPTVPDDVAARAEALRILSERPDIGGAELGRECGMSPRWGQLRKKELASHVLGPDSSTSPDTDESQGPDE